MAKDNVPFHTVFFPSRSSAREPWKHADYIKGFNWLTYYGGKFSTSQGRGVFMDDALDTLREPRQRERDQVFDLVRPDGDRRRLGDEPLGPPRDLAGVAVAPEVVARLARGSVRQWQVANAPSAFDRPRRANTSTSRTSMNDSAGTRVTTSCISSVRRSV